MQKQEEKREACPGQLNIAQLIASHLNGDSSAFPVLLRQYQGRVYSYLVRCGIDGAARDDVFQDIFLKVHLAAAAYQAERPFEPWLFAIVANTARSYFRRERLRQLFPLTQSAGNAERVEVEKTTGEDLLAARQTASWLEQTLRRLPLAQREVLLLCAMQDLSQADVAIILGLPLATVKSHLRRSRSALAKALSRRQMQHLREVGHE